MLEDAVKTEKKRQSWPINTQEEATEAIKSIANLFFFLAVLQGAGGMYLVGPRSLVDVALYALLAWWLRARRSRVAACLLLVLALLAASLTVMNVMGISERSGGNNVVLMIIACGAAIRAIYATFRYHSLQFRPAV